MSIERVDEASLAEAARRLQQGELVAFPTETVYGLGARADRDDAVEKIFRAKGRPSNNPLLVHVPDFSAARPLCERVPDLAQQLADAFLPGPLTLILPVRPGAVSTRVTAGATTVGIRVPAHPVAKALLERCGCPVAAPSANASNHTSATCAEHVAASLGDKAPFILDGGSTGYGVESTIVEVRAEGLCILRQGAVPAESLGRFGALLPALPTEEGDAPLRAPGRLARHYAPRAPTEVVPTDSLRSRVRGAAAQGERVGIVALGLRADERLGLESGEPLVTIEALADDPPAYAAELFAALHRLDIRCTRLFIEAPPDAPGWEAVRDRLARASATEP